ncbi:MAG: hypothetical protein P4L96_20490 [Rhodoferax sp.]|nr:hypothetical protein [Rhodoferax sp.]
MGVAHVPHDQDAWVELPKDYDWAQQELRGTPALHVTRLGEPEPGLWHCRPPAGAFAKGNAG